MSIRFVITLYRGRHIMKCLLCGSAEHVEKPYGVKTCKECKVKGTIAQFEDTITKNVVNVAIERLNEQDKILAISEMLKLPYVASAIECLMCGFSQSTEDSCGIKTCKQCRTIGMMAPIGSSMEGDVLVIALKKRDMRERIVTLDKLTEILYTDRSNESYPLSLANSDERIQQILKESDKYLKSKNKILKIHKIIWILHSLEGLLPQTKKNYHSGHMLPIIEANYELESSLQLCRQGFYKHGFIALRNTLELGLLSVYWDIGDNSHIEISKWLHSGEDTPFKNSIIEKLKKNHNIDTFDAKHQFFTEVGALSKELSNFVHTKGTAYSSIALTRASFGHFNETSMSHWMNLLNKVIKTVVIIHILKYPVALQYTPMDKKFGLNIPMGGYLDPEQGEAIKEFLDKDVLNTLQTISDSDDVAIKISKKINELPDITAEEMQRQVNEFKMKGVSRWSLD